MKCLPLFCTALAFAVAFAPGCKKQDADPDIAEEADTAEPGSPEEVVVSVDRVKLLRKDLDVLIGNTMAAQGVPDAQREQARAFFEQRIADGFVIRSLLTNEAKKQGIVTTDEDRKKQEENISKFLAARNKTLDQYFSESPLGEEAARKEFEDGMLIEKLIQVKVVDPIAISDAEVEETVKLLTQRNAEAEEANKALPERNAAKRAKIEELKKQLEAGADFAELAKANSDCPSGERAGGSLGTFQRGMMVKEFDDAAFTQEVGKVGDIVETQFGYHVILVTEKTPATEAAGDTPATPETVAASHILKRTDAPQAIQPVPSADEVRELLKRQQGQSAVQEYLEALKAKAKIKNIFDVKIPAGLGAPTDE